MLSVANVPLFIFLFVSLSLSVGNIQADNEKDCYTRRKVWIENSESRYEPCKPSATNYGFIQAIGFFMFSFVVFFILWYCLNRRETKQIRDTMNTYTANVEENWSRSHAVSSVSIPSQHNGLPAPAAHSNNVNNVNDNLTRTSEISNFSVLSVPSLNDDLPPAYPNVTPSAPSVFVDVNGSINDDPPSYFEVVKSS